MVPSSETMLNLLRALRLLVTCSQSYHVYEVGTLLVSPVSPVELSAMAVRKVQQVKQSWLSETPRDSRPDMSGDQYTIALLSRSDIS